jgi:hypothetical protein
VGRNRWPPHNLAVFGSTVATHHRAYHPFGTKNALEPRVNTNSENVVNFCISPHRLSYHPFASRYTVPWEVGPLVNLRPPSTGRDQPPGCFGFAATGHDQLSSCLRPSATGRDQLSSFFATSCDQSRPTFQFFCDLKRPVATNLKVGCDRPRPTLAFDINKIEKNE